MSRIHAWLSLALLVASLTLPSLSNAEVTRVEQTDPAISYLPDKWYNIPDPRFSEGAALGAYEAGTTVNVTFSGTGLTWIGYRCVCAAGIARLYLDGTFVGTVDTYAITPEAQAEIYSVQNLSAGEHNFTIEVTGTYHAAGDSAYIFVDAFDIEGSTTPSSDTIPPEVDLTGPANGATVSGSVIVTADASDNTWVQTVRLLVDDVQVGAADSAAPYAFGWTTGTVADGLHEVTVVATDWTGNTAEDSITVQVANSGYLEENDPAITYTGEWYDIDAPNVSGGSVVGSFHAGVTATVHFNGTGITWLGYRCVCAAGIARVYVDNNLAATVDTYAAQPTAQAEIFSVAGLGSGAHALRIEHTGNYHSQGDSAYLIIDAFRIANGTGSGGGDTTPPTVSITAPAHSSTLSGVVTITANAADDTGVAGVQFLVDNAPVGAEDTTAPYSTSWDTTTFAEGSHEVSARARDIAGNIKQIPYPPSMTVDNSPTTETTPPTVTLTAPTYGATLTGTVNLTATAADNVGVARVQFSAEGILLGEDSTAPYEMAWDTLEAPDGGYVVRATAFDLDGNRTVGTAHLLNVWNGTTTPPSGQITFPADSATVSGGVTITADAFHPAGVAYVSFSWVREGGGAGGGGDDNTAPYTRTWNTTAVADGTYMLRMSVMGNDGTFFYSPRIYVVVDN